MVKPVLTLLFLSTASWVAMGCSSASDPSSGGGAAGGGADYSTPTPTAVAPDSCVTPAEGCPCTDLGQTMSCKAKTMNLGTYTFCAGVRTCDRDTGNWTDCKSAVNVADGDGGISSNVKK